ncbi:hypothetical protein [Methanococcoides sp. LMO-2]|uniref:Uncharacterized protein n=1 Tax=Methanococcoides cohabitans TaxID=3136559 RepID=A0ABU9KUR5_9EURY
MKTKRHINPNSLQKSIGLRSNLSPARSNGLESIIKRIREIAQEEANIG